LDRYGDLQMRVHLNRVITSRNNPQYIIAPTGHEGQHVGEYPDVASAWHAAKSKGAEVVYLHAPNDSPLSMSGPSDTRGLTWFNDV
jgi:hypothetical protein